MTAYRPPEFVLQELRQRDFTVRKCRECPHWHVYNRGGLQSPPRALARWQGVECCEQRLEYVQCFDTKTQALDFHKSRDKTFGDSPAKRRTNTRSTNRIPMTFT